MSDLNIQLRLQSDQVQADAQAAAEKAKAVMSRSFGGGIAGTRGVGRSEEREMNAIIKARTLELRVQQKIMEGLERTTKKFNQSYKGPTPPVLANIEKDKEKFFKNMSMLSGPIASPGSPLSTAFAARQVFEALRTDKGKGMLQKMGLGTGMGGAIAGTAMLVGAATAAGIALKGLQAAAEGVRDAFNRASGIYAKAGTSGMGIGTTVRRGAFASVLGVSENEVMRFGKQIEYLSPKLATANGILAKTTMPLTQVSWEFKVMQQNLYALFAQIGTQVAPALLAFGNALNAILEVINKHQGIIKALMIGAGGALGGIGGALGVYNMILGSKGLSAGDIPAPNTYNKQLPASSWERMGLVIGGGGGVNYQKNIDENTKKSAKFLEMLATGKMHGLAPASHPSNP